MTPCRPVSFWTGQKCFVRKMESRTMTQSEESITLMTSYRLPHHGNRSFTSVQDDVFRSPSLWRFPFPITSDVLSSNRHSERRQACRMRKTGNGMVTQSEESMTLMTSYRFPHHGNRSFTSVQDDVFRSPSLWRFPFPITSDVLSSNRHSERRQACRMRKTGNGIVTRSEESIMLMTPYRFFSLR